MTQPDRDRTSPTAPPSVWDHLTPQPGPPPAGPAWQPSSTPTWQAQPWRDPSTPWTDPYTAAAPEPRRTGLVVAAVVGALVLLSVVGLVVLGTVVGGSGSDGGSVSAEGGVSDGSTYFRGEQGQAESGGTARGLALGAAAVVTESQREADRLGGERRGVRILPSPRLRQVAVAGSPSSEPPAGGRFLLVDVTTAPTGGPASVSQNDFTLLLPDGTRLREASSSSGWFDLWPSPFRDTGADRERTGTLVFDLPVGQDALLVYADDLDGAVASWRLPGAAATPVAPESLPGYYPGG